MSGFPERLHASASKRDSWLCVGLDPDLARIPGADDDDLDAVRSFLLDIIEQTAPYAAAFKPNAAFFDAHGSAGHDLLVDVCQAAQRHAPVVLDGKRGDIGNTAEAYAQWAFRTVGADALTVNPYMGHDAVAPFLAHADRGVFILARTSNPGAADLQSLRLASGEPLYERVVSLAREWNEHGNVGLVAGATAPAELASIRMLAGDGMPILVPGVGAQGGSAAEAVRAGATANGEWALVNASRAIIFAADPAEAARALRDEMRQARTA